MVSSEDDEEEEEERGGDKGRNTSTGHAKGIAATTKPSSTKEAIELPADVINLVRRLRYPASARAATSSPLLTASSHVQLYSSLNRRWRLPVPALRILIMAVGTR